MTGNQVVVCEAAARMVESGPDNKQLIVFIGIYVKFY
jgi:hypothetical protein